MKWISILWIIIVLFSCDDILELEDISQQQVLLLSPAHNAVVNDSIVTLNWEDIKSADSYQIQIAQPSFSNPTQFVLDSVISRTQFTLPLRPERYQWRVRAENSEFKTHYSLARFTIEE